MTENIPKTSFLRYFGDSNKQFNYAGSMQTVG